MPLMTDIHVRSFIGGGLKPYLHAIAKLRMEVFGDFPYFEEENLSSELEDLSRFITSKESIGVLVFDGTTLVGVSLGYPFHIENPLLLKPFQEKGLPIESYYFFGDSALLKPYRGRGIGHHFFDAREIHVEHLGKYQQICFYAHDQMQEAKSQTEGSFFLADFWRKRGYVHHPELHSLLPVQQKGKATISQIPVSFWIKSLSLI